MPDDTDMHADWRARSLLYREHAARRQEVLRHKWLESQKAGHDIGFDRAFFDWVLCHHSKWWLARHMHRN